MHFALSRPAVHRLHLSFDWAVVGASFWFVAGLLLDGWAHTHLDLQGEGVFTPFHAILYSGFVAVAAVTFATVAGRRIRHCTWRDAIPVGHGATVAGIGVFALGGALDLTWHAIFGIEQDIQAILSPTHLVLALGVALIILGPFRSVRANPNAAGWRDYAPALVAFTLFLTLVEFFTQWAVGLNMSAAQDPGRLYSGLPVSDIGSLRFIALTHDLLVVQVFSAMFAGGALFLSRRLEVPFGAVTLIFATAATLLALTMGAAPITFATIVVPSLLAGLFTDAVRTSARLARMPGTRVMTIGAGVPLVYWGAHFAITAATGGTWWEIHSLIGAPFIGVVCGVMLALLQQQPRNAVGATA